MFSLCSLCQHSLLRVVILAAMVTDWHRELVLIIFVEQICLLLIEELDALLSVA